MEAVVVFFVGLIGGFILGKRHGAKVEREFLEAEAKAKAAVDKVQERLNDIADKFK